MGKNTVSSKSKLTKVLVVFCSLLLLLIAVLMGYSFFSIKNEKQNLKTVIDLSNDPLAKKVPPQSITKEGKYVYYKFPVVFYEVSSEEGKYVLRGMAQNFQEYFESIENAKFSYELDKSKGSRYPVLVVKQNSKYGVLSRSLFGSSIILQSIEVGVKP